MDVVYLLLQGITWLLLGLISLFVFLFCAFIVYTRSWDTHLFAFMEKHSDEWFTVEQIASATKVNKFYASAFLAECMRREMMAYRVQVDLLSSMTNQQVARIERTPATYDHSKFLEYQLITIGLGPPKWHSVSKRLLFGGGALPESA